ncbi:hypothetical protein AAFC00_007053 [Neodothiora populina]|uniref:Golgi apparatus membrane protein TVP38 n=1 Tax=Neodothiora populina TaxID=2781224 RepID=A0ABR3PC23_9PEZI
MSEYTRTAQALAHTIDGGDDEEAPRRSQSSSPVFARRSLSSSGRLSTSRRSRHSRSNTLTSSPLVNDILSSARGIVKRFNRLRPLHRGLLAVAGLVLVVLGVLFLAFNERIFHSFAPVAKSWRELRGGWCILWAATFVVGFPPLIGYSTCVTLAGFVYGVPKGWLIAASGTVLGSTASFLVSRTLLRSYVERLTSHDKRFAALALTLKHDGLKLLIMIRLCPLPYSLSNGAMSTIPTVTWYQFMGAGLIATPKLILHVFVGSRLGAIAESGDKMDAKTKAISYLSIAIGLFAGLATGWFMYTKTKARAREIEEEEREAALQVGGAEEDGDEEEGGVAASAARGHRYQYSDDPIERAAAERLGLDDGDEGDDDFSMHSNARYRDAFSDVEDAEDVPDNEVIDVDDDDKAREHDPFADGDGPEEQGKGKR